MNLPAGVQQAPIAAAVGTRRPQRAQHHQFDELVSSIVESRPHLVDGWEATAVLESIGYTDARVQQELGVGDTRKAGDYVYARSREVRPPAARWSPASVESARAIVVRSGASTLIYAIP